MESALQQALHLLASWPGARWLQGSGTAYLVVNALHILGLGLLLGAILPLDLRLMGLWRQLPLTVLAPFLVRVAATGLGLAVLTGLWLFSVRPQDYVANTAFQAKLALVLLAAANVAWQHSSTGWHQALATQGHLPPGVRWRAAASALLWLVVLLAGRWIGFL